MSWFDKLTGVQETSPDEVRRQLVVDRESMRSLANGRRLVCGRLETPSLCELRARVGEFSGGRTTLREVVADVQQLHVENAEALFQVASQFNLLEMVSPGMTPEYGVGIYERDKTQGPACAIACGAGTIYRNYFVPANGKVGQSADNQIDCLADVGAALGGGLWQMRNGYAMAFEEGLRVIARHPDLGSLRELLRIGVHWNTQVTLNGSNEHLVSQAYCSALPVAYSMLEADLWAPFGRMVLEAAYEATLCAAVLNARATGNRTVFLTLLGGGAFGNPIEWILDAIARGLGLFREAGLDCAIVSYRSPNLFVRELVARY